MNDDKQIGVKINFENLDGTNKNDGFSLGIQKSLISDMAHLHGLDSYEELAEIIWKELKPRLKNFLQFEYDRIDYDKKDETNE